MTPPICAMCRGEAPRYVLTTEASSVQFGFCHQCRERLGAIVAELGTDFSKWMAGSAQQNPAEPATPLDADAAIEEMERMLRGGRP